MQKLVMGNEAIALGALAAGVQVVTGYPGTPSTEVLETIARCNDGTVDVQWSVNEKSALEVAAGASYAGARTMVTMKQVGLNVASDPLMSLAYVGVKGGMVLLVADDPGPISSQTEQDTRRFAAFAKIPVFDPATPEEAIAMVPEAFALSEAYHTPVILRPTTRVCHACASLTVPKRTAPEKPSGFEKGPQWVIFPKLSYQAHLNIEARNDSLRTILSDSPFQILRKGEGKKGIAAGGVSRRYAAEALSLLGVKDVPFFEVGIPFPFPEKAALSFLDGLDEVLVLEELDPVIEDELLWLCGKYHLPVTIRGKHTGDTPRAGENTVNGLETVLSSYLAVDCPGKAAMELPSDLPALPVRPPVLCAGCPHRASFYAVKKAMEGRKAVFCGDIGCYTLGNAAPLSMTDTCLCMGAGITVAQGIGKAEPDTVCFSFTGDSTFFHTGIPGIINAVYNGADLIAVILDNATTAMTGKQPGPSTGRNAMGEVATVIAPETVLSALGVSEVAVVNPFDTEKAVQTIKELALEGKKGVRAVIFRAPCVAVKKAGEPLSVDETKCVGCRKCVKELGCPAIVSAKGRKVMIDAGLCSGCGICRPLCPMKAIGNGKDGE